MIDPVGGYANESIHAVEKYLSTINHQTSNMPLRHAASSFFRIKFTLDLCENCDHIKPIT
jgi:hypothetical protein